MSTNDKNKDLIKKEDKLKKNKKVKNKTNLIQTVDYIFNFEDDNI
ncbi:MAG: hypothetical protein PHC65_05260 [Methanobacteriaceae archaeon]|jgi:hypothetical protein|nr:hypothetical protein [Methanobacteriaceae archaeon]MDD4594683.1 hypothetical protein [Methanobacteriaceae archaeon]